MTTRKMVLTKRLPDKTSKPVRLKTMSHKSVLTKRLPDKTSKPVLTKRLPDKASKAVLTKCPPDKTSADPTSCNVSSSVVMITITLETSCSEVVGWNSGYIIL